MDWFKTKKDNPVPAASSQDLLSLVHTMDDDLAGRPADGASAPVPAPTEPLVSFRPGTSSGVPFFSAASASPAENTPAEPSPFLADAPPTPAAPQEDLSVRVPQPESQPAFQAAAPAPRPRVEAAPVSTLRTAPLPPENIPIADFPMASAQPEDFPSSADRIQPVSFNTEAVSSLPSWKDSLRNFPQLLQSLRAGFQEKKLVVIGAIAGSLLLVAVGAGLYFWWQGRADSETTPDPSPISDNKPVTNPTTTPPTPAAVPTYHPTQPNILSFDIETVTPESIKNTFLQAGQAIERDKLPGAVEFLVRDQKLNPLAFSRFAYLAKLNVPESLLATLDEGFSVYIFVDDGRPRVALMVSIKNEAAFGTEIASNEKMLAIALEPLLLDTTTAPKGNLFFISGSYLDRPVRFANIDATLNLSIDYAIRGKRWIIGTSKDSLRAVLDKNSL